MNTLAWILLSTTAVSLLSLIGVVLLGLTRRTTKKILLSLVALSAGGLMGGAFLHLIPEAVEKTKAETASLWILAGFILFFITEKLLFWRHCHDGDCEVHTFAYMNLIGDGFHNFIDGLIIAAGFTAGTKLGLVTTLAVALHEIPQEIGDFGVLLHGGFSKIKALGMNFATAVIAVAGGLTGYFLSNYAEVSMKFLIPVAAGGFLYIAASDLIPEIMKEKEMSTLATNLGVFTAGILLMYALKLSV